MGTGALQHKFCHATDTRNEATVPEEPSEHNRAQMLSPGKNAAMKITESQNQSQNHRIPESQNPDRCLRITHFHLPAPQHPPAQELTQPEEKGNQ